MSRSTATNLKPSVRTPPVERTSGAALLTGLRASRVFMLVASLTLAACAGEIGDVDQEADESKGSRRDAGKKDGSVKKPDARVDAAPDDDDDDDDDDTNPDTPIRTQPGSDGGRDGSAADAARDAAPADAAAAADARVGSDSGVTTPAGPSSCPEGRPSAQGLTIREVALYQTIKIPLYTGGSWVPMRTAPVVQGKKALVRVFVDVGSAYQRTPVHASLIIQNDGAPMELVDEKMIPASSTDGELPSTFNFMVDPALIAADTQISVALEQPTCGNPGTPAQGARVPATGLQALTAMAIGKFRVVIVPISVAGRLPTTTPMEIEAIRAALLAYYPVPDVEISVRDRPITIPGNIAGSDSGSWTNTLNQVMRERSADRVESDVYYFGLMQPAATQQAYCSRGCILGIAPQTTRQSAMAQVGLGASFNNGQTYETIVHELGHAHGRGHAPCAPGNQIQGVDRSYPTAGGGTGVWGWDSRTNRLNDPMRFKDVMGYCQPNWISAYTYNALAARSTAVNKKLFVFNAELLPRYRDIILYADGSARWGGMEATTEPGGEPEPAKVLDASGNVLEEIEVLRMGLSHSEDQWLYVPALGARAVSLALKDRVLPLGSVLPPL